MREFLKCDAPDCDHFEHIAITKKVIDKPCPKCGANLCTKEDFILYKALTKTVDVVSSTILAEQPSHPLQLYAVNVHGAHIKAIPLEKPISGNPFPNKAAAE